MFEQLLQHSAMTAEALVYLLRAVPHLDLMLATKECLSVIFAMLAIKDNNVIFI